MCSWKHLVPSDRKVAAMPIMGHTRIMSRHILHHIHAVSEKVNFNIMLAVLIIPACMVHN